MSNLYIIAGCNGAGKTTASLVFSKNGKIIKIKASELLDVRM